MPWTSTRRKTYSQAVSSPPPWREAGQWWSRGEGRQSSGSGSEDSSTSRAKARKWKSWTACSCGKWVFDNKQAKFCHGCGKALPHTGEQESTQPGEAAKEEKEESWGPDAEEKWQQVVEFTQKVLGDRAVQLLQQVQPKTQAEKQQEATKDPVQVRKAFTQAVVAKEKAEKEKDKAEKEVQQLEKDLQAAKVYRDQVQTKLQEAEQRVQEALQLCNQMHKDKGSNNSPEEETEDYLQYQGEDPDILEVQEEVKQLAKKNEELMAEARKKFTAMVAQRVGSGSSGRTIPNKRDSQDSLEEAGTAAAVLGGQAAKMARQEAKGTSKGKTSQAMELG